MTEPIKTAEETNVLPVKRITITAGEFSFDVKWEGLVDAFHALSILSTAIMAVQQEIAKSQQTHIQMPPGRMRNH